MKKQSKYNIWVNNILYNSFSENAIPFSENEVESIKYYLENTNEFLENYPEILEKFEKLGFIVKSDFNELEYILYRNRIDTLQNKNYHLTINPTLQCNYKCWYCIVEDVGTKYEQRRMNDETVELVKKHIKYMIEVEKIPYLYLDWFGGEPLMYFYEVIYPISKYALELCNANNISFSSHATTNAYYIDNKMIDLFNEIKLTSFQIPIDGNEKKHNLVKNHNGIGHYKQIVESINNIAKKVINAHIIMRINYDKQTLNNATDVIKYIKEENRKKIFVDFQRIWQIDLTKNEEGNNDLLIEIKKRI
ncbi:MAG: radical SAM protein [Prevotellaceae bacterium]|jgi:uncharacterized protein|nr:radical SAM protein [Prevotellaceae bacterium]